MFEDDRQLSHTHLVDKHSRTLVINTLINTVPTIDVCVFHCIRVESLTVAIHVDTRPPVDVWSEKYCECLSEARIRSIHTLSDLELLLQYVSSKGTKCQSI